MKFLSQIFINGSFVLLRNIDLSFVIARINWESSAVFNGPLAVFGKFTSIPDSKSGVVTINMMRRTSITSTSGVTLISDIDVLVSLGLSATNYPLRVDIFARNIKSFEKLSSSKLIILNR